jgi:hypothetical protein
VREVLGRQLLQIKFVAFEIIMLSTADDVVEMGL